MPKHTTEEDSPRQSLGNRCAACGKTITDCSLKTHYIKVHQDRCLVKYVEAGLTAFVDRHKDGTWHCPHCPATFSEYPTGLQDHVRYEHHKEKPVTGEVKRKRRAVKAEEAESSEELAYPQDNEEDEDMVEDVTITKLSTASPYQSSIKSDPAQRSPQIHPRELCGSLVTPPPQSIPLNPKHEPSSSPAIPRIKQRPRIPAFLTPSSSIRSDSSSAPTPAPESSPPRIAKPLISAAEPPESQASQHLPPALNAFFKSLKVPLQHLGDIFVENGFDTEDTLNLLCELPPEEGWLQMKEEIVRRGKLSGWLTIQIGLKERAKNLAS